jgi:hypothetical protein
MKQGQCTVTNCEYYKEMEVSCIFPKADFLFITNRCVYCTNYVGFRLFVEGEEYADRKET